jgi:hypothetical protein
MFNNQYKAPAYFIEHYLLTDSLAKNNEDYAEARSLLKL